MTVKLFRTFTIEIGDQEITPIRWRTTKAQELFMYLIQHRGQTVRKSTLIDMLWPGMDPERALSQLYTSAYYIRKKLEDYSDYIHIISTKDSYLLKLQHVDLDVENWEAAVVQSDATEEHKIRDFVEAMALNTGDYMQEYDYWWAESERYRLKVIWLRVSLELADMYMRSHQKELAERVYRDICLREPQAEEAHFALMKIWADAKQDVSVHNQYRILKQHLKEQYHVAPNSYITEWYEDWAKRNPFKS
jgi:two-component SAPR family response regulator